LRKNKKKRVKIPGLSISVYETIKNVDLELYIQLVEKARGSITEPRNKEILFRSNKILNKFVEKI
jgi:hypothetical protein